MASRLPRLLAAAALTFFLIGAMSSTSFADSSNSNAGGNGKSAEHANANAGANEHAANNPHAESAAPAAQEEQAAAASQQTATASASTSSGDSSKANRGCNQTPYGSGGNGANTGGPYDDTCDGSASGNGNGGGKATGKPCAGCVGKADEKNPPGQQPGPSDKNKGYECDGNKGIGRTNPAHTGCKSNPPPNPGCVPTPTVPCTTTNPPPTEVEGETLTRVTPQGGKSTGTPVQVLGEVFERPAGTLAFTGDNTMAQASFGAGLVLCGAALALVGRRRRPALVKAD